MKINLLRKIFVLSLPLGCLFLFSGCTSGPQLQKYPRAQIERPYTLPRGVATWTTYAPYGYFSDRDGSSFVPPIPIPLFWQTALSDDWTLNWVPFPLSISHQFFYSKEQVIGATLGIGGGYASSLGVVLSPLLNFYHRITLGKNWALETTPTVSAQYATQGGDPWEWSSGLFSGPLFQLTPTFAVTPKLGVFVERGYQRTFLGDASIQPAKSTNVTLPLSFSFEWSFARQWDFDASYTFNGVGYPNGFTSHAGVLKLTHFW